MGVPYEAQLEQKSARIGAAFALYPHLPPAPGVHPAAAQEGYRHRLKLPVEIRGDRVRIGLQHPKTGEILDTPDCPVLAPRLREGLAGVIRWMGGKRGVHSLDLRVTDAGGQLQVVLACEGGDLTGGGKAARALKAVPGVASVAVSRADPARKRVMGSHPQVIAGAETVEERIGEARYHLTPGAFFQIDPRTAAWVHAQIQARVKELGEVRRVLDLYAGVGAYARMLAPMCERVVAVEEVPQAAAAARIGAPANLEVRAERAERVAIAGNFDLAILNPARRGSDPALLARLAAEVPRLIYVSCSPETLARDLDCLAAHGMRVVSVQAVDFFPQTPEVESLVYLERGPALTRAPVEGGFAYGPWRTLDEPGGGISGAEGRPLRAVVLAIGDAGAEGSLPTGRYRRIATVASHSLLLLELTGPLVPSLSALTHRRHPIAGHDPRTAAFFADKAGLVRPFIHVIDALDGPRRVHAPLHGDLVAALGALGFVWLPEKVTPRGPGLSGKPGPKSGPRGATPRSPRSGSRTR